MIYGDARSHWLRVLGMIFVLTVVDGAFSWLLIAAQTLPPGPGPSTRTSQPTRYHPGRLSTHALAYYGAVWGINDLTVKAVESGELIRFSYQVLEPQKASLLNDKAKTPYLIAPDAGIRLSIPTLEKVGQLRQSGSPEYGKSYWMAFSNPGRRVKPGDRVDIVIGQFRAQGLVVE